MKRYPVYPIGGSDIYRIAIFALLLFSGLRLSGQTAELVFSGELQPSTIGLLKHALESHPDHQQSRISTARRHIWVRFKPGSQIRQSFFACLLRGEGLKMECYYQSDDSTNTPESRLQFKECLEQHRITDKTASFNTCATPLDVCDGQVIPVAPWGPGPLIGFGPSPPNNPEYDPFFGPFSPWNNPWLTGTNYGCILDGENNTIWLRITVAAPGNLEWAFLFPDFDGLEYIYMDWSLFPLTPTICADLAANNASSAPIRCNWNDVPETPNAATGMVALASSIPIANEQDNFEVSFPVVTNQQFLLCLDNYSDGNFNGTFDFTLSPTSAQVCGAVLPAGHTELAAEAKEESILLGWVNLNPGKFSSFQLQRAVPGKGFSTLGELSDKEFYQDRQFTDHHPIPGKAIYRIRRTDGNGDYSYSNAVEVEWKGKGFTIFPHPASGDGFQLWLADPATSVTVMDASGKRVYQTELPHQTKAAVWIDARLAAGLYTVQVHGAKGGAMRQKMLVR